MIKLYNNLPEIEKQRYLELFKELKDVFAWKYEDLKTYDTQIIQHKIPLNPGTNLFVQKLQQINPILIPVIQKETHKLFDVNIIIPLRYSSWVENLDPVRKKNGKIRLCVYFWNLNKCLLKDNYPLPKMDRVFT